jgi:hypothetical protein
MSSYVHEGQLKKIAKKGDGEPEITPVEARKKRTSGHRGC